MKEFFKTALITGLVFGVCMALVFGMMYGWPMALPAFVGCGVPFGLAIAGFSALMRTRMAGKLPLMPGEEMLKEGPANHFLNGESVGGWLYLTNRRLHFVSHKINVQAHEWNVALDQIASAKTVMTARIIPNGLNIRTAGGISEHFVVNNRSEWVDALARAKGLRI